MSCLVQDPAFDVPEPLISLLYCSSAELATLLAAAIISGMIIVAAQAVHLSTEQETYMNDARKALLARRLGPIIFIVAVFLPLLSVLPYYAAVIGSGIGGFGLWKLIEDDIIDA